MMTRARKLAGGLARWGAVAYLLGLVALTLLMRLVGEQWWLSSVLIYVPPHLWFLPLPGLLVLAIWVKDRKARFCLGAAFLFAVLGLLGYRFGSPEKPAPGAEVLKVITNNMGEDNDLPVVPFLVEEGADIIALQDVSHRRQLVQETFRPPEWHVKSCGQHLLVSRYPIRSARLLPVRWRRSPAAVFEVEWKGRLLSIYSVHIPTPRTEFRGLGAGRLENPQKRVKPRKDYQEGRIRFLRESMAQRVEEVRHLTEVAAADPNPTLLLGDFNMPSWGYLHGVVAGRFTDAFHARGRGFGFTVLAEKGNPLLKLGPWLRLDYVFTDEQWRPLRCWVEGKRQSQHRAVVATLEWKGAKP